MNKKLMIALAFVLGGSYRFAAPGYAQPAAQATETPAAWTLLTSQNGVNVLATEVTYSSNRYLYLQFENTSGDQVVFGWELRDKNGRVVASTTKLTLAAGASLSGFDDATLNGGNMNLLLEGDQSITGFTIHITKK